MTWISKDHALDHPMCESYLVTSMTAPTCEANALLIVETKPVGRTRTLPLLNLTMNPEK